MRSEPAVRAGKQRRAKKTAPPARPRRPTPPAVVLLAIAAIPILCLLVLASALRGSGPIIEVRAHAEEARLTLAGEQLLPFQNVVVDGTLRADADVELRDGVRLRFWQPHPDTLGIGLDGEGGPVGTLFDGDRGTVVALDGFASLRVPLTGSPASRPGWTVLARRVEVGNTQRSWVRSGTLSITDRAVWGRTVTRNVVLEPNHQFTVPVDGGPETGSVQSSIAADREGGVRVSFTATGTTGQISSPGGTDPLRSTFFSRLAHDRLIRAWSGLIGLLIIQPVLAIVAERMKTFLEGLMSPRKAG